MERLVFKLKGEVVQFLQRSLVLQRFGDLFRGSLRAEGLSFLFSSKSEKLIRVFLVSTLVL